MKKETVGKKPGRKGNKIRSHVSLSEAMNAAAEFLGSQTFRNKTAYLEHLILNDLQRTGLTIPEIMKLTEDWRAKQPEKIP